MIAALEERPRSPIALIRRENKELLDRLAPESPTRVRCCCAQLISYFEHWQEWKVSKYPTGWIYQPLREIRHDLMDAYSIHVVRDAIRLLQEKGLLSVRKNDRATNARNGQDRTHQYYLHKDRIKLALENLYSQPAAETLETTPFVNIETPSVNIEIPNVNIETPSFTVETYTQIPTTDSCSDSCTLSETRKKLESSLGEEELEVSQSKLNDDIDEVLEEDEEHEEDCDNKINPGTDQFSAVPAWKCVESPQDDVKPLPKLKSDRSSGFRSDDERKGFYKALLELGKTKGVRSPVAWSAAITKSIDNGDPCQYLIEYREGLLVGSCEKQEWEVAPGQPYEQFVTYLKTKNKKAGMTDEEAIAAAHHQLNDVNLAKSLWESCKRAITRYQDDWGKQKLLGVQNAYLPPELLPSRDVSVEQLAGAIQSLQAGCAQLQGIAESDSISLDSAIAEPEPAKELPSESVVESGSVAQSEPEPEPKPTMAELQEKLNSHKFASAVRIMIRANSSWGYRVDDDLVLPVEGVPSLEHLQSLLGNKVTANRVRRLIDRNPDWGFLIDEENQLWDF